MPGLLQRHDEIRVDYDSKRLSRWKYLGQYGIKSHLRFDPDDRMEVTKTLRPGDRGTARLLREYGDRLVCVRYRFDYERNKHLTTVEIIVDERGAIESHVLPASHNPPLQETVIVRIDFHETELREQAKQAKGVWDPERRGWILPYPAVRRLGLEGRII